MESGFDMSSLRPRAVLFSSFSNTLFTSTESKQGRRVATVPFAFRAKIPALLDSFSAVVHGLGHKGTATTLAKSREVLTARG